MAIAALPDSSRPIGMPQWQRDLALAFLVAMCIFAYHAMSGFTSLRDASGDNDSLLRLVQVRDLLQGQGWFDLHQYRMGLEGGFVMHWSRLVDAPIAAIILAASAMGGSPAFAEATALVIWPMLLFGIALFLIVRMARTIGGDWAAFPAIALGAGALYFVGVFRPGALDHHNVQIVVTFAMVTLLLEAPERRYASAFAGACAALMLTIGMETAPYVAVAGVCVSAVFLFGGPAESVRTAGFGAAFAVTSLAAFLVTVGPSDWVIARCDSFSNVQLSLASLAGFGLAAVALLPAANATFARRLVSLGLLGLVFATAAGLGFPQCLDDPYAGLGPRLRENWLTHVTEAQSIFALAGYDWTKLLVYHATPFLALLVHSTTMVRSGFSRSRGIYVAFLAAAVLVGCWQVRGSMFAIPLATVALAAWVGSWRERAAHGASALRTLAMVAIWIVSFNIAWGMAGHKLSTVEATLSVAKVKTPNCYPNAGFARLAEQPKGTVLAVSDLGSPILANTPLRVLSGPYHRNVAGNLLMMEMMMGEQARVEALAREHGIDYVVLCQGNPETFNFAQLAPGGLLSQLAKGNLPNWLERVPDTEGAALEIYRVRGEP